MTEVAEKKNGKRKCKKSKNSQKNVAPELESEKHNDVHEDIISQHSNEAKIISIKKKSKKKKNIKESDNTVSDQAFQSERNSKSEKKENLSCELPVGLSNNNPTAPIKKKSKKKVKIEDIIPEVTSITSIPCDEQIQSTDGIDIITPAKNKKRKKKRKAVGDPVILENKNDATDDGNEVNNIKKKKVSKLKKKQKVVSAENTGIEPKMIKKKKKKVKRMKNGIGSENVDGINPSSNSTEISSNGLKDETNVSIRKKKCGDSSDDINLIKTESKKTTDETLRPKLKKKKRISAEDETEVLETKRKKEDKHQKENEANPEMELGQWQTAKLSNATQQDKFIRLLGGVKSKSSQSTVSNRKNQSILGKLTGVWKPPQGRTLWGSLQNKKSFSTMALDKKESEKLASNLESQFNETLAFNLQKRKEGNTAKGLGFQEDPAKGKKHIDIFKVKSVALD